MSTPRRGALIGAVLIDGATDLAGQRGYQSQSTSRVVLFDSPTVVGHVQASLAVPDARDQSDGNPSAAFRAKRVLDAIGCDLVQNQAEGHCAFDR